jgi:AcrR family transcriptional regulator
MSTTSREAILAAATTIAQAHGYGGLNFRDLAAMVGIKPPSIYHHFPSKADIGVAVAKRYREDRWPIWKPFQSEAPILATPCATIRPASAKRWKTAIAFAFAASWPLNTTISPTPSSWRFRPSLMSIPPGWPNHLLLQGWSTDTLANSGPRPFSQPLVEHN